MKHNFTHRKPSCSKYSTYCEHISQILSWKNGHFWAFFWLSGTKKFYLSTSEAMKTYDFLKVKSIILLMHLKPCVLSKN